MFKDFGEAVFTRLNDSEELQTLLCRWNGRPALFHLNYPSDSDTRWEGKQYPRVAFYTQMGTDVDTRLSGTLILIVHTDVMSVIQPEQIDEVIKNDLSYVLFNTQRGVFCCNWKSSEPFLIEDSDTATPRIKGLRIEYDLISFPDQRTYLYPDPVPALEDLIKEIDEEITVINRDEIPDILEPTSPVAYVRTLDCINLGKDTYYYRPMGYHGSIHVICTSNTLTRQTIGKLNQEMMLRGRTTLENDGQMLITDDGMNTSVSYLNNVLFDGQFEINSEFRLLRERKTKNINHIYIKGEYSDGKEKAISEAVKVK